MKYQITDYGNLGQLTYLNSSGTGTLLWHLINTTMEVLLRRRCCVWCNTEAATPPQPLH